MDVHILPGPCGQLIGQAQPQTDALIVFGPFQTSAENISGVIRKQQIRQKAENLQLLSIMQSDRGKCCMIGNKILYEGEYIKDFKVRQIGDSFVKLEWDPERKKGSSDNQSDVVGIMLNLTD